MLRTVVVLLTLLIGLMALAGPASAHERREVGTYTLVVGWNIEPALEGSPNGVLIRVNETTGGRAVSGVEQTLKLEVTYGGLRTAFTPALAPVRSAPGSYIAEIIPTRAGDYTFRFSGKIEDLVIDERFESGPGRFETVRVPDDLQYPDRDGSASALAREMRALDERVQLWRFAVLGAAGLAVTAAVLALAALVRTRR